MKNRAPLSTTLLCLVLSFEGAKLSSFPAETSERGLSELARKFVEHLAGGHFQKAAEFFVWRLMAANRKPFQIQEAGLLGLNLMQPAI